MKTKREIFVCSLLEFPEIEKRLEKRAQEGWRLKSAGSLFWTYEEAEPKKVQYSIVFFPKTDALEPEPPESLLMMREYCERTGWKLAAEQGQMQIFCNEEANPVPIETEAWIQVKNIHETMKKGIVLTHKVLLINAILQLGLQIIQFLVNPLDWLARGFNFYLVWCWIALGVGSATELIHYHIWYKKARRMAEEEEILYLPKSMKVFRMSCLTVAIVALLLAILSLTNFTSGKYGLFIVIWTIVLVGVPIGGSRLLKKWKVSAKWNRFAIILLAIVCSVGMAIGLFVCISKDENFIYRGDEKMVLQLSDFTEVKEENLHGSSSRSSSLFLFREEGWQHERWEDGEEISTRSRINYTILVVEVPFIYDLCKEKLMAEKNQYIEYDENFEDLSGYRKIDMPVWDAQTVYQYFDYDGTSENEYLVCYKDRMIQIDFGWEVTEADVEIVKAAVRME